jgi:hypothetical protein
LNQKRKSDGLINRKPPATADLRVSKAADRSRASREISGFRQMYDLGDALS